MPKTASISRFGLSAQTAGLNKDEIDSSTGNRREAVNVLCKKGLPVNMGAPSIENNRMLDIGLLIVN